MIQFWSAPEGTHTIVCRAVEPSSRSLPLSAKDGSIMIRKSKAITIVAALAVLVGTTPTPAAAQKGSCGWIPQGWDDEEGAMHGGDGLSISNLGTPAQN